MGPPLFEISWYKISLRDSQGAIPLTFWSELDVASGDESFRTRGSGWSTILDANVVGVSTQCGSRITVRTIPHFQTSDIPSRRCKAKGGMRRSKQKLQGNSTAQGRWRGVEARKHLVHRRVLNQILRIIIDSAIL